MLFRDMAAYKNSAVKKEMPGRIFKDAPCYILIMQIGLCRGVGNPVKNMGMHRFQLFDFIITKYLLF